MRHIPTRGAGLPLYIMLGLWTAGREYAVSDLVIFALTAVVGLVVILVVFWFWETPSRVSLDLPLVAPLALLRCATLCSYSHETSVFLSSPSISLVF